MSTLLVSTVHSLGSVIVRVILLKLPLQENTVAFGYTLFIYFKYKLLYKIQIPKSRNLNSIGIELFIFKKQKIRNVSKHHLNYPFFLCVKISIYHT